MNVGFAKTSKAQSNTGNVVRTFSSCEPRYGQIIRPNEVSGNVLGEDVIELTIYNIFAFFQ